MITASSSPGSEGCGLFLVLIVLAFVGVGILNSSQRLSALHQRVYQWALGLGTAVGIAVFLVTFFGEPAGSDDALLQLLGNGILWGFVTTLVLAFLLPFCLFVCFHVVAPPFRLLGRFQQRAAQRRARNRDEERRRQEQRRYEHTAPQREQASRAQADALGRREDARANCELLYNLHAHAIGERFPRALFDDFLTKYMGDTRPPEYVEQRAAQLRAIIEEHHQQLVPPATKRTLADLATWFLREKEQIDQAPLSNEDKVLLLAQLEARYTKLQEKHIRGLEP